MTQASKAAATIRRSNLSTDAYAIVRDLFLHHDRYRPGDKISVEQLSRELGVSRTPLWGAINRLEAEGILNVVPRQGVYLIGFDSQRLLDIYVAREALEGMVARMAAARVTAKEIVALEEKVEEQTRLAAGRNRKKYEEAALAVHEMLAALSGNAALQTLLASVFAQIRAMRVQSAGNTRLDVRPHEDHEGLLKALRAGDGDRAEAEARNHIRALTEDLRRRLCDPADEADAKRPARARRSGGRAREDAL